MSDLDRSLDDFGRRLGRANLSGARPPRGRRAFLAVGVASAIGVAVLVGSGGNAKLDAVAEARAALNPNDAIIHLDFALDHQPTSSTEVQKVALWYGSSPPRWRLVQVIKHSARLGAGGARHGSTAEREELAYNEGELRMYQAKRDTLTITQGYSDRGRAARPPGIFGNDTDLRALLATGRVRDTGTSQAGGRLVRRLVGTSSDRGFRRTLVYDVDPHTFAPVAGQLRTTFGTGKRKLDTTTRFSVLRYQRLTSTPANARALQIRVRPATRVARFRLTQSGRGRKQLCGFSNRPPIKACPRP